MMGAVYANTAGHTKKMIVYAIGEQRSRTQLTTAYIGYCVGNIVGPQTFKAKQAPQYTGGAFMGTGASLQKQVSSQCSPVTVVPSS
jgi:hypothetical protein